jgi:hypothetical protein
MHSFGRDFDNEDEMDDYVDYLISEGILEEDGFDEDGDVTYTYNFEKMKEKNPELYEMIISDINESLLRLYELGFVKVDYDENLQAHFSSTEDGEEFFRTFMEDK